MAIVARATYHVFVITFAMLCVAMSVLSCNAGIKQYVVGDREQRQRLRGLWAEIDIHTLRTPQGLAALEFGAQQLIASGHPGLMHRLLTTQVLDDPDNPYNAAILLLVADHYADTQEGELAAHYYRQIVTAYSDIHYSGESAHLRSLRMLVELTAEPEKLAEYYRMLIYRFPDHIDIFDNYRSMIQQYQRIADWPLVFQSYRELLAFCDTRSDLCQNDSARVEYIDNARARVRFFESDRYWTTDDLDVLAGHIKQALAARSASQLLNWQARVNFFARSWEQEEFDFNSQINFNIGIFLRRSSVSFEKEVDSSSNAQEAYLRTWGWSHRIPTWYFYFRKIDFPADPEVHGNWEWAGIFFGELL